jgi:hypothetical protein
MVAKSAMSKHKSKTTPTTDPVSKKKSLRSPLLPKTPDGRGRHPKSLANLTNPGWPKGVSGNPGGRPRKKPLTDALREYLDDPKNLARVITAMDKRIRKGDIRAIKELIDRVEGKVSQRVELTGEDGEAIQVADVRAKLFDKLGS